MPSVATITRFGLMRHAETFWNREKRIQGQSDSALTTKGKKDADSWGRQLSRYAWNRILISDTGRAVETAGRINHHLNAPVERDPRLREQDWGRWTGCRMAEVEKEASEKMPGWQTLGWKFCPPDGEDRISILERSKTALREAAGKWPGDCILVVTHEGVIKSLVYHFCGRRFVPEEPALIKPMYLHWLVHDKDGLRLEKVNAVRLRPD